MPRLPRLVLPGIPRHITQRGNYRQKTYFRADDYRLYLQLLKDYSRHHGVAILGDCLMPNHVHLVAVPQRPDSFARAIHMRLRRVGHLWQARYGSAPMDEKHFWAGEIRCRTPQIPISRKTGNEVSDASNQIDVAFPGRQRHRGRRSAVKMRAG